MAVVSIVTRSPVVRPSRTTSAAKTSPPTIGPGMLYFARKPILRVSSAPSSNTRLAASKDGMLESAIGLDQVMALPPHDLPGRAGRTSNRRIEASSVA